jgi:glycosyltransferase involved in cell wall biosynthesis
MKIAIFLMDLGGGGAERVMINLARGFVDLGLEVELVLVKAEGPYLSQLHPNIKVVTLNCARLISSLPTLITYLKTVRPSVLMSALEDTNLVALWARKLANVPTQVIVTVHNNLSRESQNATQLKRKLTPQLVKLFYPWADQIVAVSQGVAQDLIKIGLPRQKVHAIYNPIITADLLEKLKETLDHPWFSPEQPPVIIGVGRLTKQKDFSTLIKAFAQVKKQKSSRLLLLGDGEERSTLENLVQSLDLTQDVQFMNFVANPYIYMAKASVLVLSSAWEGFGNVLVEAMISGTAVVSTDCESGPAEILANGKFGRLVEVGNAEEMAKAILETLAHPPEIEALRARANEFTLEKSIAGYQLLLPASQ